jgi:transcriptional regulator with XRE-family HTH domain
MNFDEYLKRLQADPEYVEAERALTPVLDLANDVLSLRIRKGWSQEELARRMGTRQSNVSRVENGLANPTVEFLQKLAKALGTELVIRLKSEEEADRTKYVVVWRVPQEVYPVTESQHQLTRQDSCVYYAGWTSYASETPTSPERVKL